MMHVDAMCALRRTHGVHFLMLCAQVYTTKSSMLMVRDGELQRYLQIVKVWLSFAEPLRPKRHMLH
eukprot:6097730-Amphidinium_carterae.2